jgi:hypothetical protein
MAVFHLQFQSPNIRLLLQTALQHDPIHADLFHPHALYHHLVQQNGTVELLPSAYFEPFWVAYDIYPMAQLIPRQRYGLDRFDPFFDPIPVTNKNSMMISPPLPPHQYFFPGAFAFHWHNQWTKSIMEHSITESFMQYFDQNKRG